jgi:hypothetical protein
VPNRHIPVFQITLFCNTEFILNVPYLLTYFIPFQSCYQSGRQLKQTLPFANDKTHPKYFSPTKAHQGDSQEHSGPSSYWPWSPHASSEKVTCPDDLRVVSTSRFHVCKNTWGGNILNGVMILNLGAFGAFLSLC